MGQRLTRPPLRWHGGKWRIAPWIVDHLPRHRVYCEPYGGGASVLIRKPRSDVEVYNDLDSDVVNLFRVLRSDDAPRLLEAVALTPFSREEHLACRIPAEDPVERARRTVARSFMSFGSGGTRIDYDTGFRSNSHQSNTAPARDWMRWPEAMRVVVQRLRGVCIENRSALEVMDGADRPDALHYVDPPYLHETRVGANSGKSTPAVYAHEMTKEDHVELLAFLRTLKGAVVLSGYPSKLYDDALEGWQKITRTALADGAKKRTEVLWINPQGVKHPGLFD